MDMEVDMDIDVVKAICMLSYKLACLFVGTTFCYFGYRLFLSGIVAHAGDLNTRMGKFALVLRNAAPGTFFAVLGAAIVLGTVFHGIQFPGRIYAVPDQAMPSLPEPGTVQ